MANVSVSLNGASMLVLDTTTNQFRVNSIVGTLTLPATDALYSAYFIVGIAPVALTLPPVGTAWFAYIKNLHATQTIAVTCTPAGGSAWVSPLVLEPGGIFMYLNSSEAGGGVTAISLLANGVNTPAEILLAA